MGIVHRDVSLGNVMYDHGQGKLADLEYCMEYDNRERTVEHQELTVSFLP